MLVRDSDYGQNVTPCPDELITNKMCKKDILVWGPALSDEPIELLATWIHAVTAAGFENIVIIINGQNSKKACQVLAKEVNSCKVKIEWLNGPSIGSCHTFATDLFLKSNAKYMLRIDPDGQFPIRCTSYLLQRFVVSDAAPPDAVIGQRDEGGTGGCMRYIGNILLRLLSIRFGNFTDPNCGIYVLNRKAAAALQNVALPKWPETRILKTLKNSSLRVTTQIVTTMRRRSGRSSIKGLYRCSRLFFGSVLEMLS